MLRSRRLIDISLILLGSLLLFSCSSKSNADRGKDGRQRISINDNWKFFKYESADQADDLIYDVRPDVKEKNIIKEADAKPTEAENVETIKQVLKPWIMPTSNEFIKDSEKHYKRPDGNPGSDFPFVKSDFDDSQWKRIQLPHDWAIKGPFYEGSNPEVGGGMGRLPSHGVAWYRRKLDIPASDAGKSIFLDVDGAMSYAMVWINGKLAGGWPYGYNSWRVDLTPYIIYGKDNQLAIRLDNPNYSARWYPGGGIYRNVWLVKTSPVHVAHWGSCITTTDVSKTSAKINIEVKINNDSDKNVSVEAITKIFAIDEKDKKSDAAVAAMKPQKIEIPAGEKSTINNVIQVQNPRLWGPLPTQSPNRYVAETTLLEKGKVIDTYETKFGIREIKYDADSGVHINGELVKIKGVNNHHDLGALGAAFNMRAAERQLEILREMGCNAIRMSHNPPAPELLELTDRMGFLVMDEVFDSWERKKTPWDFHLIFPEWYEQDLRSMLRRDRNHPSIIIWSVGNEVGEQYTDEDGAEIARRLCEIVKEEDSARPTTTAMNWAKPHMPLPGVVDAISLNYQGEGIRQFPEFENTNRIRTTPQYDINHETFPGKIIIESESASAFSSRGIYLFPVTDRVHDVVRDGRGGDSKIHQVTSYELHSVDFGASVDKVFKSLETHPFVAGEFVWTGFDYIGEPTPYYSSRSSYCGIIDLAGFRKNRFYLYQSQWRPELPMVHILPHWNWPDRIGKITPIHIFTSGDEVELFLNGKSLGRKKKGQYEYRLRWDDVKYEPGEVKAIAYKNGEKWAEEVVKTTGTAVGLSIDADRSEITADGKDLSFITVKVIDEDGQMVPDATNKIKFEIRGNGEIVATDNGDPTNFTPFPSHDRKAFSGMALVIVKSKPGVTGSFTLIAKSEGLKTAQMQIKSK